MAMHVEGGIDATARMHPDVLEPPKLTFAALNAKIDALPKFPEDSTILPKQAKWRCVVAIAGALSALPGIKLLSGNAICTAIIGSTGVAAEIAGVVVAVPSGMPGKWPTFASERRGFAAELDFDLTHHLALVDPRPTARIR
ncbi:hypothetical protein [Rhodanobacter geophilus]|uniref:Uncharacterized protein n=1 Tax=Rhodanobacter geophilus TaxID=3162488 RepID=A0ABV3QMW6_9GAMM